MKGFFSTLKTGFRNLKYTKPIQSLKKNWILYLMCIPAFIFILLFCYGPMFGIVISFQDFELTSGVLKSEWVGLKHFKDMFNATNTDTYRLFRNTIFISLIRIATNFPIILIYTLIINSIAKKRVKQTYSVISYIPYFISWVAISGMMYNLFSYDGGLLNQINVFFGKEKIDYYNEDKYWWVILAISSLWKGLGWGTLVYLSSLGTINKELYEACKIDGGGNFRQAMTVTLPGIKNIVLMQLILDISAIMLDSYDQILAVINGSTALNRTTYVVGTLSFDAITKGSGFAAATAFGLVQGIIGFILVLVANKIVKKSGSEGIL